MLHNSEPARRGRAPAAAWTVADALYVAPPPQEQVGAPAGHPGSRASQARYPHPLIGLSPAGDGVGWGAVDHLVSNIEMVHMPTEMSMGAAVTISSTSNNKRGRMHSVA